MESKEIDHEVQKQPLVINNTLETPHMNANKELHFRSVSFFGGKSVCFR